MTTSTATAPVSLGSSIAELSRARSERQNAELRQGANNGLMHIVALLGIDWKSLYRKRSESLDSAIATAPEVREAEEAQDNAARRAQAARMRVEDAEAERAAAVDRHAHAVRNGSDEDAQAARSVVISLDANAALVREEVVILSKLANEASDKCRTVSKRERDAHRSRISEELRAEHSAKFDAVLKMLNTAEFRAALSDLAAVAELRSELSQNTRLESDLRNILSK